MTDRAVTSKLLYASELFHYANKFRGQVFVIVFQNYEDFFKLVTDLKVIHKAQINLIIVIDKEKDFYKVQDFCSLDLEFKAVEIVDANNQSKIFQLQEQGFSPVVNLTVESTIQFINNIYSSHSINKLIFAGYYQPIKVGNKISYYLTQAELVTLVENDNSYSELMIYLKLLDNHSDLVLIEAKQGILFKEIFSYLGAGTLITAKTEIKFSRANVRQVAQIFYILLSYVEEGAILPVSESEIVERIDNFFVLSIDDAVIGVVSIKHYENSAEVAKLCTLPRYRQQGLAGRLIKEVIRYCKEQKLDSIFALSTSDKVLELFNSFGFINCPRESLPESWKKNYDFNRNSKACRVKL